MNTAKGFTLIELLTVISIISMLASVILVPLNYARKQASDAQNVSSVKSLQEALELYYADHNAYPVVQTPSSYNQSIVTSADPEWQNILAPMLVPKYLPKLPSFPITYDPNGDYTQKAYVVSTVEPTVERNSWSILNGIICLNSDSYAIGVSEDTNSSLKNASTNYNANEYQVPIKYFIWGGNVTLISGNNSGNCP